MGVTVGVPVGVIVGLIVGVSVGVAVWARASLANEIMSRATRHTHPTSAERRRVRLLGIVIIRRLITSLLSPWATRLKYTEFY